MHISQAPPPGSSEDLSTDKSTMITLDPMEGTSGRQRKISDETPPMKSEHGRGRKRK